MTTHTSLRVVTALFLLACTGIASPSKHRAGVPLTAGIFGSNRYFHEYSEVRKLFSTPGAKDPVDRLLDARDLLDTFSVPTEILDNDWDTAGNDWMGGFDQVFEYDTLGRETERTFIVGMFNFWMPQVNHQRTYDGLGHLTRIVTRNWDGFGWMPSLRDSLLYNLSGLPVEERLDQFSGSGWVPYQRYLVSYDGGHRPVEVIGQSWSGSAWANAFRFATTYDGEGREVELLNQGWTGSEWANNLRATITRDIYGNPTEELDQFWSAASWNNFLRYSWAYDGSNFLTEELYQEWVASAWVNESRDEYSNNSDGYPEQTLTQYWNGVDWSDDKVTYSTYDGMTILEATTMTWTGFTWENFHKTTWSWQQFIKTAEITQQYPVIDKWNMVSVPLGLADYARTTVFPASISNAFTFDAGYSPAATLENGRGYWLKFDGAQNVSVTGLQVQVDTFSVTAGWNMVGSIGVPVSAATVGSIPGGMVSSNFFSFNNGYTGASVIEPGKGYWVKVAQAGQLILTGAGNTPVASRLRMELDGEMPPAPPSAEEIAGAAPAGYSLDQNYPNPFNPVTTIRYSIPAPGRVVVSVFNMVGQEVARLVDEMQAGGGQSVAFDASALPSGVYTCRIASGTYTDSRKMLLVK